MQYVLEETNAYLNLLGTTSGDTGSAAIYGALGKDRLRVFMMSPHGRMSPFQQKQMYCVDDPNIVNLAVEGTFDDAQDAMKAVNNDAKFKDRYSIGAVNSTNLARVLAQVVYYFVAYLEVCEYEGQVVTVVVPSGNFGNAYAAHIAQEMGLPIKIIIATNKNDVLDVFSRTGVYRPTKVASVTDSPSMDITKASNLERFVYDLFGKNPEIINQLWTKLGRDGSFEVDYPSMLRHCGITSGHATDDEGREVMAQVYADYGYIMDPHTACAASVGFTNLSETEGPLIILETARPEKFDELVFGTIGIHLPVPERCRELFAKREKVTVIEPNPEVVKQIIANTVDGKT